MKTKTIIAACCAILALSGYAQTQQADYRIVPLPQNITQQKGKPFVLKNHVTISCNTKDEALKRDAEFLREYVREPPDWLMIWHWGRYLGGLIIPLITSFTSL